MTLSSSVGRSEPCGITDRGSTSTPARARSATTIAEARSPNSGAHAPALTPLPHRGLSVRRTPRPLAVPGGPAPVAPGVRLRTAPGSLQGQGARLQRLPTQGCLHGLRHRARGRAPARSLAALRGRALPSRSVAAAGGARDLRRRGRPRSPPRARRGGPLCGLFVAAEVAREPPRPSVELPRAERRTRAGDPRHRRRRAAGAEPVGLAESEEAGGVAAVLVAVLAVAVLAPSG